MIAAPRLASLGLLTLGSAGCYQALAPGYMHRLGEGGGPAFEGQYVLAFGDMSDVGLPSPMGKVSVAVGDWGVRVADTLGIMFSEEVGDVRVLFRPGLAFLVIGTEERADGSTSDPYFGIGLETDLGLMFPLAESAVLEVGLRAGGDLGYTGDGTAGFVGAFLGFGWATDAGDFTR